MDNFTTNTYQMKRDILNFSKKICKGVSKPETKFVADMVYGILPIILFYKNYKRSLRTIFDI